MRDMTEDKVFECRECGKTYKKETCGWETESGWICWDCDVEENLGEIGCSGERVEDEIVEGKVEISAEDESIRRINDIANALIRLTDQDFQEAEKMYVEQESYSHPFKNAQASQINAIGRHNRRVLEALRVAKRAIEEGKTLI